MQMKEGVQEQIYSPQSGYPLQAQNPEFIGVSDDDMRSQFLDPVRDRLMWTPQDENGVRHPIGLFRNSVLAASLRTKILSGILPRIYGEKLSVDHQVRGNVVHTYEARAFVGRAERVQLDGQTVDAEFRELPAPEERPDIAELRRMAAKLAVDRPHTAPEDASKVPIGKPTETEFRPNKEDAARPPLTTPHVRPSRTTPPTPKLRSLRRRHPIQGAPTRVSLVRVIRTILPIEQ
jgi:hypothetical protein